MKVYQFLTEIAWPTPTYSRTKASQVCPAAPVIFQLNAATHPWTLAECSTRNIRAHAGSWREMADNSSSIGKSQEALNSTLLGAISMVNTHKTTTKQYGAV